MAHNIPNVNALVEEFNQLPRQGNWCIGIENIFCSGHFIFAFDPDTEFYNFKGRTPIVYGPGPYSNPVEQANAFVLQFLELFVSCFDMDEFRSYGYGDGRVAPLKWALVDPLSRHDGLLEAIQENLRALGVREDLCNVSMASTEAEGVFHWHGRQKTLSVVAKLSRETNSRLTPCLPQPVRGGLPPVFCTNCGNSLSVHFDQLGLCGWCQEAWYCGKLCQIDDWEKHKKACYESPNVLGWSQSTKDSVRERWQDVPPLTYTEKPDLEETDEKMDSEGVGGETDEGLENWQTDETLSYIDSEDTDSEETDSEETDSEETDQVIETARSSSKWSFSMLSETEA
jgi:MYND finger